jgi:hypothetical protein
MESRPVCRNLHVCSCNSSRATKEFEAWIPVPHFFSSFYLYQSIHILKQFIWIHRPDSVELFSLLMKEPTVRIFKELCVNIFFTSSRKVKGVEFFKLQRKDVV